MSRTAILAQPIRGEVTSDGRLLTADARLLAMHFSAGGDEGGLIAIPGLLALARQCARLGMGLARNVTISDGDVAHKLWVETRLVDERVELAILSMRPIDIVEMNDVRLAEIDEIDGHFLIETDAVGRLVALFGDFPLGFDSRFVGKPLVHCISFEPELNQRWEDARQAERSFVATPVKISDLSSDYALSARPSFSADGALSGYQLDLRPIVAALGDKPGAREETISGHGNFFGQKLAPALRQPLGRIIANAETIGAKLKGPLRDNYAVYAKDISEAAKHLVSLVDDLGDLEAIEKSDFKTAEERVDLGDAARRISGLLALKAADHQIKIQLPDDGQNVAALAEFRRVLQILLNLVNNAIRYSPDGSVVKLEIAQLQDTACLTVSDQGAGIAAEDVEKIFEKFERLGRSGDGGSGLGLYISRRLARAMDGDLTVSEARGGGACFALTLPAAD